MHLWLINSMFDYHEQDSHRVYCKPHIRNEKGYSSCPLCLSTLLCHAHWSKRLPLQSLSLALWLPCVADVWTLVKILSILLQIVSSLSPFTEQLLANPIKSDNNFLWGPACWDANHIRNVLYLYDYIQHNPEHIQIKVNKYNSLKQKIK